MAEDVTELATKGRRNRWEPEAVRQRLIEAAIVEFAAHGFEGASTRSIAARAHTHQPQINYHFDSKEELWRASLVQLLAELEASTRQHTDGVARSDDVAMFAGIIRGLVVFASQRPELNRIMIQEATTNGDRLQWLTGEQLRWRHGDLLRRWRRLRSKGLTAPLPDDVVYHTIIGASSLIYANAPEARLLGIEPDTDEFVRAHADALIATLLPNI